MYGTELDLLWLIRPEKHYKTTAVCNVTCRPRLLKNLGELKIVLLKMHRRAIGELKSPS